MGLLDFFFGGGSKGDGGNCDDWESSDGGPNEFCCDKDGNVYEREAGGEAHFSYNVNEEMEREGDD